MRRRTFVTVCLLGAFVAIALAPVSVAAAPETQPARRPNVVFILADDLGYTDLGCYGSGYYETPNIDRMARTGVRFTSGYAAGPNCQPTRAALMTGQYAPRTGVYTVGSIDRFDWRGRLLRPVDNVAQLPLDRVTIAQAMKRAGYATGMSGKWHLGEAGIFHPARRGFDEAVVSYGQHVDFKTNPKTDVPDGAYLADFLTNRAVDFIGRHRDEPFFLYLPHFGVHTPLQAKKDVVARFKDKPPAGGHNNPTYAAMIASVDDSVGRVLAALDEFGLADDTLVVFSSDNGGVGGYAREGVGRAGGGVTDNAPLRGGKGMLYEGGVRVPYVFRWPGRIPAGRTCDVPITSVDLYPTLLALAGAEPPPPADQPLDGVSYLDLLTGKSPTLDRDAIYWHFPGYLGAAQSTWRTTPAGAIRAGDWKLIESFEDGRLELYDLKNDAGERRNVAVDQPERVWELHAKLKAWRAAVKAQMPAANAERRADEATQPGRKGPGKRKTAGKAAEDD